MCAAACRASYAKDIEMSLQDGTQVKHEAFAISASQLFDRKRTSTFLISVTFILTGLIVALIGWANVMPLAEVAISTGEIVTATPPQEIQHLEGGIVERVHVHEGDHVRAGDLLVTFAPVRPQGDLQQVRARRDAAISRARLLQASLLDTTMGEMPDVLSRAEATDQRAVTARRADFEAQISVVSKQIAEAEAEQTSVAVRRDRLEAQLEIVAERLKVEERLVRNASLARMELLRTRDSYIAAQLRLDEAIFQDRALSLRIQTLSEQSKALRSKYEAEATEEVSQLLNEARSLSGALAQAEDQVKRLQVFAPVEGRVQELKHPNSGAVVAPAETIMTIIPDTEELRVKAKISTRDIGHIDVGAPVEIKVQTFDHAQFGVAEGHVLRISPSTLLDEQGLPYFDATVVLDGNHVGEDEQLFLTPGMTVEVDIITGNRSVLAYLLAPIKRSIMNGLHER